MVDIIELRSYARVKEQMEAATDDKYRPTGPLAKLVTEIGDDLLMAEYRRKQAEREKPVSSSG